MIGLNNVFKSLGDDDHGRQNIQNSIVTLWKSVDTSGNLAVDHDLMISGIKSGVLDYEFE